MNTSLLTAALALCFASLSHAAVAQLMTEFPIARSGGEPLEIAWSPDGMWFTEHAAKRIGLITPGGIFSEFPVVRPPIGIVYGPDGNVWFTSTGFVSRMTPSGVVTDFPVNQFSLDGYPSSITAGPDGRLWFTDADLEGGRIGQVTVSGQVTNNYIQAPGISDPTSITQGFDGTLWFTVFGGNGEGKIGRVTPSGVVTMFPVSGARGISGITWAPDGNLWFTETITNKVGRITPSGVITEFSVSGSPRGITVGLGYDRNPWFTESTGNKIGHITTRGDVTEFAIPTPNAQPWGIAGGPDGNIWFVERGAGQIAKVGISDGNPYTLRLGGDRFHVTAHWASPHVEAYGVPVALTPEAGYFWFFEESNVEVVVKMLDWCPDGGIRFFAAGLTNFYVELIVTDTLTGFSKTYVNPQGVAFQPILDTISSCAPGSSLGIAGAWTGTYKGISYSCDTSAQASFQQTGSTVLGTLTASGSCGDTFHFNGTLRGNTLSGSITDYEVFEGGANGTLSGLTLEMTIDNGFGKDMAQIHLHR